MLKPNASENEMVDVEQPGWKIAGVLWLWHAAAWLMFYVVITTAVYLDPQMQTLGRSWGRVFLENSAYPLRMTVLSIGVWGVTKWVWQMPFGWGQRVWWYMVASLAWVGISAAFKYVREYITGTASATGFERYVLWSYVLYWAVVASAAIVFFYRQYRKRETEALLLTLQNTQLEAQLTQMQLQTLKAQLKPHFLFNMHNALAGLVRKGDRRMALKMLAALSDLLRKTLAHNQAPLIPLREELAFIQRYLDLEQIRFQERLYVTIDVDEAAQDVLVPAMLLQPLVENAIRHGVAELVDGGRVCITGHSNLEVLEVNVYNDGPLLPAGWRLEHQDGIGLRNTHERLQKHYGTGHFFEVTNNQDCGVVVKLQIPHTQVSEPISSVKRFIDA